MVDLTQLLHARRQDQYFKRGHMTERDGFRIQLPTDPEQLRLLEAREEAEQGGEPACLLNRLCPGCDARIEAAGLLGCPYCGAELSR
ncbi:MAG TPA: hypothetical protein VH372_25610 [Actinospica sp.]|jgi:hypothetical protein|nr:hypothetical protein [Actinospica sp.]